MTLCHSSDYNNVIDTGINEGTFMGAVYKTLLVSPGRTLIFSIMGLIALGTLILMLPAAQWIEHDFIDILFMVTSTVSATGLVTIPLHDFTYFGQCIILALMQIGGIGFITLTIFLISLFVEVGLGTQLMTTQLLELESWRHSKRIMAFILALTFFVESIGTAIFYYYPPLGTETSFFYALFHAVSSFCSVGFTLYDEHAICPSAPTFFLLTSGILSLIGELGFLTWHEILKYCGSLGSRRHYHVSLHTKLVITMTSIIMVLTTLCLFTLKDTSIAILPWWQQIPTLFFNALSWRSTGFTTVPMYLLNPATLVLIIIISFIGSSPGSTGSGIKTTTCAILFGAVRAIFYGKTTINLKGREIPFDQILKALAIFTLSILWIACTTMILLYVEPDKSSGALIFESFSAFTNLGLSLGITQTLSLLGKSIVIVSMIIGRIGSLTLVLAFKRKYSRSVEFHYPEERVMLG